jgi:integrase
MGNYVEPIREKSDIEKIKKHLKENWELRDLLFFVAGINFALRVQDLLAIKVRDMYYEGKVREYFDIVEGKTKKKNRIYITDGVKKLLKEYISRYPYICINPDNYIFFRQRDENPWKNAIGRRQALNVIHSAIRKCWMNPQGFGTHTLRKTWAYQARKNDVAVILIQNKLNHSSLRVTERYLWIKSEEIGEACLALNL